MPSLPSMTKPEPSEETLRSDGARPPLRLKKSSKNSSNGAPFGTLGSGTPSGPFKVWLVEMLTTASISFSATGATLLGPRICELAGASISTRRRRAETGAPDQPATASGRHVRPARIARGRLGGRLAMNRPAHGQCLLSASIQPESTDDNGKVVERPCISHAPARLARTPPRSRRHRRSAAHARACAPRPQASLSPSCGAAAHSKPSITITRPIATTKSLIASVERQVDRLCCSPTDWRST